ncbi:MAG: exo-alpha-sialidase [Bacteroidetes bacterium]|nr:exo-alpha-sialidase [Bacteroidota bacterium]
MLNRSWEGIPSIGATDNGSELYVAWYSGGKGEGPGNYVTVALSRNRANDWQRDALVVYPKDTTKVRMYDPGLWRDKYGVVRLTWAKSHQYWDGVGGVWSMPLSVRGNQLHPGTVSLMTDGVMLNKPAYLSSSESLLYPVSGWGFASSEPGKQGAYVYTGGFSVGGTQLSPVRLLSKIVIPDSLRTFDEHQIVETGNGGELLALVRTSRGVYYARSNDYGAHWSQSMPFTAIGPSPSSRFHISRLKSGKLLLVANASTSRTNMTAFLSTNGGKTWPHRLVLDRRANVSYPDAIQTNDGSIHVVYDRDRFTTKDILYCRFTEADIIAANEKKIVRSKVNR